MDDCIFCKISRGEAHSWKVYEDEHTMDNAQRMARTIRRPFDEA